MVRAIPPAAESAANAKGQAKIFISTLLLKAARAVLGLADVNCVGAQESLYVNPENGVTSFPISLCASESELDCGNLTTHSPLNSELIARQI